MFMIIQPSDHTVIRVSPLDALKGQTENNFMLMYTSCTYM